MPVSWRMQDWEGNGYCDYEGYGFEDIDGGGYDMDYFGGADKKKPTKRTYFTFVSEVKKKTGLPEPLGCLVSLDVMKKAYASGWSSTKTAQAIGKVPRSKARSRKTPAKKVPSRKAPAKKPTAKKITYTVKQLREMAKKAGLSGYSKLKKNDLLRMLQKNQKKKINLDKTTSKKKVNITKKNLDIDFPGYDLEDNLSL